MRARHGGVGRKGGEERDIDGNAARDGVETCEQEGVAQVDPAADDGDGGRRRAGRRRRSRRKGRRSRRWRERAVGRHAWAEVAEAVAGMERLRAGEAA